MTQTWSNPDMYKKSTAQMLTALVQAFGVFSLLATLRSLDARSPEELVDIALNNPAIRPLQDRTEFLQLANLVAAQSARTVLEIGTFRGGTLFVFARLAQPDATLISVDLPSSRFGALSRKFQEPLFKAFTRERQRLILFREDSHAEETRAKVERTLLGDVDLLFIDGDHSYEGVKSDFDMYSPFVRGGGVVVFHDIAHARSDYGVRRFWNEVKVRFKHLEIVNPCSSQSMGIGVLWNGRAYRTY